MTEEEFIAQFRRLFDWKGTERLTAKQWSADHGFSQSYISDVLRGRRGVSDRMAEALGYRRVVSFYPQGDRSPEGGDGLSGSVHDSAGPRSGCAKPGDQA